MEYFAGLDVSMKETHVCIVDRDGKVILEARTPTAPKTIATALAKGPAVERLLFETGRIPPSLFHGLTALGLPVVCERCLLAFDRGNAGLCPAFFQRLAKPVAVVAFVGDQAFGFRQRADH